MVTPYRRTSRKYTAETTVIYFTILLAIAVSSWLPYFFAQWTLYTGGFITP